MKSIRVSNNELAAPAYADTWLDSANIVTSTASPVVYSRPNLVLDPRHFLLFVCGVQVGRDPWTLAQEDQIVRRDLLTDDIQFARLSSPFQG